MNIIPRCGDCGKPMERKTVYINGVCQTILECINHDIPLFEIMDIMPEDESYDDGEGLYEDEIRESFEMIVEDHPQPFELLVDFDNN